MKNEKNNTIVGVLIGILLIISLVSVGYIIYDNNMKDEPVIDKDETNQNNEENVVNVVSTYSYKGKVKYTGICNVGESVDANVNLPKINSTKTNALKLNQQIIEDYKSFYNIHNKGTSYSDINISYTSSVANNEIIINVKGNANFPCGSGFVKDMSYKYDIQNDKIIEAKDITNYNNNESSSNNNNNNNESTTNNNVSLLVKKYNLRKVNDTNTKFTYCYEEIAKEDRCKLEYTVSLSLRGQKLVYSTPVVIKYYENEEYKSGINYNGETYEANGKNLFPGTPEKMLFVGSYGGAPIVSLHIIDANGDLYSLDTKNNVNNNSIINKKPNKLNYVKLTTSYKFVDFYEKEPEEGNGVPSYYVSTTNGKLFKIENIYNTYSKNIKLGSELK